MNANQRTTFLGRLLILLFVAGCFYGAYYFFFKKDQKAANSSTPASNTSAAPGDKVQIGIAYGTEKKRWLEDAVEQFHKTDEGENISVELIPMGSLEGAQALMAGDQRIHIWSPASAAYKDVFVQDWQVKYSGNPILKEENLALTPMVFVMWEERYQSFIQKYKEVTFATIGQALNETGGWDTIAQKPEWGLFKFGHTHPNQSNSGLITLVLMAYTFHQKQRGLELKDILNVDFQTWMNSIESGVGKFSNSTGNLMREMVLKGPSSYDALFVYESVVIDYLKNAEGRWGSLRILYPKWNMWNENPYYIIDSQWSSADQKKGAESFLSYLFSETLQRKSLIHGFRPGNPAVPIRFQGSPFLDYQRFGLKTDIGTVCEPPRAEVINNLLASWQRTQGSR